MGKRVKREDAHCGRCGAESAWINGDPKGSPSCDCVENLAEIANLRAEAEALRSALSAARAALDGEMGHADLLAFTLDKAVGTRREAADAHRDRRARRAAEAQPTPVRCPECDGTGRRVKYHGGSINDPNLIGLAMESLPCRCQAEAQPKE